MGIYCHSQNRTALVIDMGSQWANSIGRSNYRDVLLACSRLRGKLVYQCRLLQR